MHDELLTKLSKVQNIKLSNYFKCSSPPEYHSLYPKFPLNVSVSLTSPFYNCQTTYNKVYSALAIFHKKNTSLSLQFEPVFSIVSSLLLTMPEEIGECSGRITTSFLQGKFDISKNSTTAESSGLTMTYKLSCKLPTLVSQY